MSHFFRVEDQSTCFCSIHEAFEVAAMIFFILPMEAYIIVDACDFW